MRKILMFIGCTLFCLTAKANLSSTEYMFNSQAVSGTTTYYTAAFTPYNTVALFWEGSGARVKGVYTAQRSEDTLTWVDVTKDYAGATITMAITSTGTTTSGIVDLGDFNSKYLRMRYVPDAASSTVTINGSLRVILTTKEK
jgi:hypothetical protein